MTARAGGAGLLALSQSIPSLGRTLAEIATQRQARELQERELAANEQYRSGMLGVQRDQLAATEREREAERRQQYIMGGFDPGDGPEPVAPRTGDLLTDTVNEAGPLSLGSTLAHAALGREIPTPRGPRYNPDADPQLVRERARLSAQAADSEADRQNRIDVAGVQAGSRERVAGMRGGGGGGHRTSREDRDNANGIAAGLVEQHGGIDGAERAVAAMPDSPQKTLVVAALHDLRYDRVHHNTVTPPRPARAAKPTLAEIAARLQPAAH